MLDTRLHITVAGTCWACRCAFTACAGCVNALTIDPVTNRPPDVSAEGHPIPPDPAALARSSNRMICDACVMVINSRRPPSQRMATHAARYERIHMLTIPTP